MEKDEREQLRERLWKVRGEGEMPLLVDEICARARRREMLSVIAYWTVLGFTGLFATAFVWNLIQFRDPWLITGTGWALAALCFISWRLLRKGPTRIRPAEPCAEFLRRELESKRQGFLFIRWLSVLLFPAILSSWWGDGPALRAKALGLQTPAILQFLRGPVPLIVSGLILAFIWFAFSRQARKVDGEIEQLRADERA